MGTSSTSASATARSSAATRRSSRRRPRPRSTAELRDRIGGIAVDAARAVGYRSAGTIEGLLDPEGNYWFLEMNTRIQVEHTITELVTGLDLVREQVLIAAGEPTSVRQEDIRFRGHAIECRINAEDPASGFLPTPGVITAYREPAGPGVRVDSGVTMGSEVVALYDPLIAKLCVWDTDRERARRRMLRALEEFLVEGVSTLIGFHRALLAHPCFVEGDDVSRGRGVGRAGPRAEQLPHKTTSVRSARDGRVHAERVEVELDGRRYAVNLLAASRRTRSSQRRRGADRGGRPHGWPRGGGQPDAGHGARGRGGRGRRGRGRPGHLRRRGDEDGERDHRAPDGTVTGLSVAAGEPVSTGQVICVVAAGRRRHGSRSAGPYKQVPFHRWPSA